MSLMVLRVGAAIVEARLIVVLQIGADALHVGDHVDAVLPQQVGRADAGELQQLRRVERAAREDHFAVRARHVRRAVLDDIRRRPRGGLRTGCASSAHSTRPRDSAACARA